ncbi:cAMP-dependent protein kinase regulatory subunit [Fulvia fulva]|uniref:cAMP-dependent protein kinase regulatory subunit n=1 Tax=Passalora fulva TaxID=5499 RepID=A0A9Q8PIA0_PASFU|nr:cAMP-dependent protein kinase regulatory subunit [Fulvia fulva]KAK4627341.1 cAMP-dependent protein kinase regulatory subunit [Fulvia fulva]KAK4628189.1 cAMP-dependent protein kinase regulatory subunit [Fulvia fulva]UJO22936.1 cAMP-dependent protein kinase regulatory subunit [Fulvia fulva]WPV13423.1 cAMP-dependent protein kinase regulatory subunit [Fulvia fulva]WPV29319.1 cAMP-dependent protein kinase regulatory subunit [Fulvia fulva]
MSLPSDFTNEINALSRQVLKEQPKDILQYCANFFHRRLESQRAEFLLSQRHSRQPGMAESNFPGSNPFGTTSTAQNQQQGAGGMHSVAEEEEHDFQSPTASSFPPHVRDTSPGSSANANTAPGGTLGNFGFGASNDSRSNALGAAGSMEQPQSFPNNYNMGRRTSVSAESLAPASADDNNWKAPVYPKTQEQVDRLREAVSHNFLFSHLDDEQSSQVLDALQERKIPAKDVRVIVQGDAGDFFYVVEQGSFDIYVSKTGKVEAGPDGMGSKVAVSGPGTSFGELALMYNAPRAATVVSTEPSTLWQLDRITFRRILMDSAFQRRRMYESFLEEVPLLKGLTPYERSKIADALESTKYPAGSEIIREGDVGDRFFILESGEAYAAKRGQENRPLKTYKHGDYFGELALLEDRPRAASVLSKTEVKVATLEKDGFQRLLGPVESIMRRDDPRNQGSS